MMSIEYFSKDQLATYSAELTEACIAIFGDVVWFTNSEWASLQRLTNNANSQ